MRVENLVSVLARRKSGIWLLGGVAAVLGTVERLMTPLSRRRPTAAATTPSRSAPIRSDFFTIKRTQGDVGLTYWVLQGHGIYASFELFDTWTEAVEAVNQRLAVGMAQVAVVA